MKDHETRRTTFAEDTKLTPAIVHMIEDVARISITTIKERREASQEFYEMLKKAMEAEKSANQEKES